MNTELVQRIRECSALPSLPAVALKVLELSRQDDADIAEIAKVITKDAALLMDIGMLVLDQTLGERYAELVGKGASHEGMAAIEDAELRMNHAEVGGVLAEHWKLPPVLAISMARHHAPDKAEEALRALT